MANFRSIFAYPRARCASRRYFEAVFIHGLFPYVALLLLAIGETRASIIGLLIAAFAVGGPLLAFGAGPHRPRARQPPDGCRWHHRRDEPHLHRLHFQWAWQVAIYGLFGSATAAHRHQFVTELSQTARGAAASLDSCFFYPARPSVRWSTAGFAHGGRSRALRRRGGGDGGGPHVLAVAATPVHRLGRAADFVGRYR
jgi:hypothetical protein